MISRGKSNIVYTPRIVDGMLRKFLTYSGAVLIEGPRGCYILTGSSVPADDLTRHTGVARFLRLQQRTMTSFERLGGAGNVSLQRLQGEPSSPQIEYESVFNRNGMALLLFRKKNYAEDRARLEAGIANLQASDYAEQLHHTVLTSNLLAS